MLENIADIFANHNSMMGGRLKKPQYKQNMYNFRVEYGEDFQELIEYVSAAEDKKAAACEVGTSFSEKVFDLYAKKGKVKGTIKADLSLFMIYYVFPAILLTNDECATVLCDELKDAWNLKFNEKIGYTDYDTIYDGFKDKIFGLF